MGAAPVDAEAEAEAEAEAVAVAEAEAEAEAEAGAVSRVLKQNTSESSMRPCTMTLGASCAAVRRHRQEGQVADTAK